MGGGGKGYKKLQEAKGWADNEGSPANFVGLSQVHRKAKKSVAVVGNWEVDACLVSELASDILDGGLEILSVFILLSSFSLVPTKC